MAATRDAGCDVQIYHPPTWFHLGRLNNRTHRKLLIVDGTTGFTGGVGMGNEWLGDAQDQQHWRESHYQVEGPVVSQMQAVFVDNWIKATGRVLHGPEFFPVTHANGGRDGRADVWQLSRRRLREHALDGVAGPHCGAEIDRYRERLLRARQADRRSARHCRAPRRRVRIVVPGRYTDARVGRWAAQALYGDLLDAGVELYEYQPTMIHCKVLVIDGLWTSVGSANFDDRSFRLNDEANLNVFSAELAAEQLRYIEADIAKSKRMVLRRWARRSPTRRVYENLALLLRSQL